MKKLNEQQEVALNNVSYAAYALSFAEKNYAIHRKNLHEFIWKASELGVPKTHIANVLGITDARIHQIVKEEHANRQIKTSASINQETEIPKQTLARTQEI